MPIPNPFESLRSVEEYQEPRALSQNDPYAGLRVAKGAESEMPFYQAPESMTATLLDTIPFGKYMLPEERDKLDYMTEDERNSALAWSAAGAALFFLGGPLLRGAGRVASSVTQPIRGGLSKIAGRELYGTMANRLNKLADLPIEDKLNGLKGKAGEFNFEPFNLEDRIRTTLRGKNFVKEEVDAITQARLHDDPAYLRDAVLERKFQDKPSSGAWNKYIEPDNKPYGGFKFKEGGITEFNTQSGAIKYTPDLNELLSTEALQNRHYTKQYRKVLSREVLGVRSFPKDYDKNVLQK